VTADVDVALQHVGALLGVADDADARPRTRLRQSAPEVGSDELTHLPRQLLHTLVGNRVGIVALGVVRALGADLAGEHVGRLPCVLLQLTAHDLQAHAEAQRVLAAVLAARPRSLLMLATICSTVSPQKRCTSECFAESSSCPSRAAAQIELRVRLLIG